MSAATESRVSGGRSLRTRNTERRRLAISSSPELPRKHDHSDDEYGCASKRTKKTVKAGGRSARASVASKAKTVSASVKSKSSVLKKANTRKSSGDDSGINLESSDECLDPEEVLRITNYRYKQLFLTDSESESDHEEITSVRCPTSSTSSSTSKLVSSRDQKAVKRTSTESKASVMKKAKTLKSAPGSDAGERKRQEASIDVVIKIDGVTSPANFENGVRLPTSPNNSSTRKLVSSRNQKADKRASTESGASVVKKARTSKSAPRSDAGERKRQEASIDVAIKSDGVTSPANFENGDFSLTISVEEPSDGRNWYIETTDDERKNLARQRRMQEKLEEKRLSEEFLISRNVEPMSCDESESADILDISMMGPIDVQHIIDLLSN